MSGRRAICIIVDGLRASALGAYGNTWHATPALDELASRSVLLEWMWPRSLEVGEFYRDVWGGDVAERLSAARVQTAMATDDAATASLAERAGFNDVRRIDLEVEAAASTIADTATAAVFALAVDQVELWASADSEAAESADGRLLWIHLKGMYGPWDAPLELREGLLADDDIPAPKFTIPPQLANAKDHDELLAYRAAYAAQVIVLDECLGGLLEALAPFSDDGDTLVLLAAPRGFALGEHGEAGLESRSLYSELLHVPCLICPLEDRGPRVRVGALSQPSDIRATLDGWFGAQPAADQQGFDWLAPRDDLASTPRQYVVAIGESGQRALRTPAWMLRSTPIDANGAPAADSASGGVELYAKPDDRWELNEVADRCGDVARRLLAVLEADQASAGGKRGGDLDGDLLTSAR